MRAAVPATLEAAEEVVAEFRQRREFRLEHAQRFAVELLLREALANAVNHGCHGDPAKQVRCSVRLGRSRLIIAVEDDGDGFDWRAAWDHPPAMSECSGRGIEILQKYANRVRYNDRGNAVTIIKRFC
jgi:anti-sigma regulatory factor (Ser/Thr protein kinase)